MSRSGISCPGEFLVSRAIQPLAVNRHRVWCVQVGEYYATAQEGRRSKVLPTDFQSVSIPGSLWLPVHSKPSVAPVVVVAVVVVVLVVVALFNNLVVARPNNTIKQDNGWIQNVCIERWQL